MLFRSYTLFLVSRNTGMVLTTQAAKDPEHLDVHVRRAMALGLRVVVPLAIALAVAAPLVLRIYGDEYVLHATTLLRLLALTMIPAAVPVYAVTIARVQQRLGAMVAITAMSTLPTLVVAVPLFFFALTLAGANAGQLASWVKPFLGGWGSLFDKIGGGRPRGRRSTVRSAAGVNCHARLRLMTQPPGHREPLRWNAERPAADPREFESDAAADN